MPAAHPSGHHHPWHPLGALPPNRGHCPLTQATRGSPSSSFFGVNAQKPRKGQGPAHSHTVLWCHIFPLATPLLPSKDFRGLTPPSSSSSLSSKQPVDPQFLTSLSRGQTPVPEESRPLDPSKGNAARESGWGKDRAAPSLARPGPCLPSWAAASCLGRCWGGRFCVPDSPWINKAA